MYLMILFLTKKKANRCFLKRSKYCGKIELIKREIKLADVCQGEPLRLTRPQRSWPNKYVFGQDTLAEGEYLDNDN